MLSFSAAAAEEAPAAAEVRHGTRPKRSLSIQRKRGGGYMDFKRGTGRRAGGYSSQNATSSEAADNAGAMLQGGDGGAIAGMGASIGAGAAKGGAVASPKSGMGGGGAAGKTGPGRIPEELIEDGLEVEPANAVMKLDQTEPVVFKVKGIARKEDTLVCYQVLTHPSAPQVTAKINPCARRSDFKSFSGNKEWAYANGVWTGTFRYEAAGWGTPGIVVRSVFLDSPSGRMGGARLEVSEDGGTKAFDFPPYANLRTDFDDAASGTLAKPLRLVPCTLPVVDWQTGLCSRLDRAAKSYPAANSAGVGRGWTKYWVTHVNDEPAFEAGREGPPGQSLPLTGDDATVLALDDGFRLAAGTGGKAKGNLYVGVGVESGRGAGAAPIAPDAKHYLHFDVTLEDFPTDAKFANSIHVFVETRPAGKKRFTWLFLGERHTGYSGELSWNWPVSESMWKDGAKIDMEMAAGYAAKCKAGAPQIPFAAAAKGKTYRYALDLETLLSCVSKLPADTPITGIHWAVEQNSLPGNLTKIRVRNPSLKRKAR